VFHVATGFARPALDAEALEAASGGILIAGHEQRSNGRRQYPSGSTTNDLLMWLLFFAEYMLLDQPCGELGGSVRQDKEGELAVKTCQCSTR
jgi:hypothetical protein